MMPVDETHCYCKFDVIDTLTVLPVVLGLSYPNVQWLLMGQKYLTRRKYSTVLVAGITATLAGCTTGDDVDDDTGESDDDHDQDDGDDDTQETDDDTQTDDDTADDGENDYGAAAELTITLENEDGDPVSEGVEVHVSHDEEGMGSATSEIEDGVTTVDVLELGPHTVRVESLADEFDPVEESIDIEGDEEITMVIEGAPGDDDDEDGEDGEEDEGDEDDE